MDEVVSDMFMFISLIMLGGYALFAFAVAYFNKSRRACMCGLTLTMIIIFFSGCASNPHGALFQGDTKACAPYAVAKAAQRLGNVITNQDIERLSSRLSTGENGAYMANTLAMAREAGWISEYKEVLGMESTLRALENGDVLFGLPVFSGLKGWGQQYWPVDGRYLGRHAILCTGYKAGVITLLNSYGPVWGSNGRCWLREEDLELMYKVGTARAWVVRRN